MNEKTQSSKKDKSKAEEKPFDLAPEVLEAIQLVQQKAWPVEHGPPDKADYQEITVQVPLQIRRDILTFVTALFHLLDVDQAEWFQHTFEDALVQLVDSLGSLPVPNYAIGGYNRKRLVERITGAEEDIQE